MLTRSSRCVAVALLFSTLFGFVPRAFTAPAAPAEPAAATLETSSGRRVFWRGEEVGLALTLPLAAAADVDVAVAAAGADPRPIYRGRLEPVAGVGRLHLLLPSGPLGDGVYTATATVGTAQATTTFTVRETTVTSPGMVINELGVAPQAALAYQTGQVNFMNDLFTGLTGPAVADEIGRFDAAADVGILVWSQDSSRPMSFNPPHSAVTTDGEYRRRIVLGNTSRMRYPAFAGAIFDYDPQGFGIEDYNYNHLASYWQWGSLAPQLKQYLAGQQQALVESFTKATGLPPLSSADAMRLAVGVRSPESMGYLDQPTRRWAYETAARSPTMPAEELATLKTRGFAWYDTIMSLNARRYAGYLDRLRRLDPTLAHSTSNTINHSSPRTGNYHPGSYGPLDFRFVAVWDDQGGVREHIYETVLAATLLGGNRRPEQPLWIDTVFAIAFPGNHFRNSLQLAGRGAQGTGYSFEIGSSLTYENFGRGLLDRNDPFNQEVATNARLMRECGGVFSRARPEPRVGLLYSKRQIAMTPYAQSYTDGQFKMIYLLSHVGLPPALVTEEMLAGEAPLPESLDAVLVLGQHEELPEAAFKALAAFAARGGRVIADAATTVTWPFLERSAALDLPFRDPGHPYNAFTAFNRGDQTVSDMRALAAARCPQLRALLQDAVSLVPLDSSDPDVAICTLAGGQARYLTVANDSMLDLERLFAAESKAAGVYERFLFGADHGRNVTSSWMPLRTPLRLSPALGDVAVYDVLSRTRLTPERRGAGRMIVGDLTAVPARLYAILPAPVAAGRLTAAQTVRAGEPVAVHYQAEDDTGQPLAAVLPVSLTLRGPDGAAVLTLFRATDEQGSLSESLPTGSFITAGRYQVEARQLCDGAGITLPVAVTAAEMPQATVAARVAVRDPEAVRRFFAAKPDLVVPVLDPASKPAAERLVAGLQKRGITARVWENPQTVTYALSYAPTADEQADNAAVDRGEALGRVRFENGKDHVNANFYGSAFTGYRFGKPVVLLGAPGTNAVLDAVKASGLPWTDAATAAPGGALVQWLPEALGRDADTLIVLGADATGLEAAIAAVLDPPARDSVTEGVRAARQRMMAGRGLVPGGDKPAAAQAAATLTGDGATPLPAAAAAERFSLAAITDVQPAGGRLLVSLARYGSAAAIVDPTSGETTVLPAVGLGRASASPDGARIFTTLHGLTTAWSPEGKIVWNAAGEFAAVGPETGSAIIQSDGRRFQISADGVATERAETAAAPEQPQPRYRVEGASNRQAAKEVVLEGVKLVDAHSGAAVDVPRLAIATDYLCSVACSADGQRLALAGRAGNVRLFAVADGRDLGGFHAGAYPRLFALPDGGFAAGSSDGLLTLADAAGKVLRTVDLDEATARAAAHPEAVYAAYREVKPLAFFQLPAAAGDLPLARFRYHIRDEQGALRMVTWPGAERVDFRWADAVQAAVTFPKAGSYTVTLTAAAKYFDDLPMNQPSWDPILKVRDQVVTNERPDPTFRLTLNGKPVGTLAPVEGRLVPFVTQRITVGWANLEPKPEELTTFTGTIDVPAGSGLLAIEPIGMTDCVMTKLQVE